MCGRYLLKRADLKAIAQQVGLKVREERATRYNIAPGTPIDAVRAEAQSGELEMASVRWGLLPAWAAPGARGAPHVNARAEGLAQKPTFRKAFQERRCAIPASGFFEWKRAGRERQPWLFELEHEEPFFLAGLWERSSTAAGGDAIETCAIVTTAANDVMQPIHDRMPVMLLADEVLAWIRPKPLDPAEAGRILAPFTRAPMRCRPLSQRVNSVAYDDEECLAGPAPKERADGEQLSWGV